MATNKHQFVFKERDDIDDCYKYYIGLVRICTLVDSARVSTPSCFSFQIWSGNNVGRDSELPTHTQRYLDDYASLYDVWNSR